MINSTNTVNIDGAALKDEEFIKVFTFNNDDKFSKWVIRPIAVLTAIGMGMAMLFASAFLIILSLAMLPLLAVSYWAVKAKMERDVVKGDTGVEGQDVVSEEPAADVQTSA